MAASTRAASSRARTRSGVATRAPRAPRSRGRTARPERSPAPRTRGPARIAGPRATSSRWSRTARRPLRRQIVRVLRQVLVAVLRDQHEILEAAAAELRLVEPRLERDHVADLDRAGVAGEPRSLVDLEPDAVAEPVVEAAVEHLALLLRELCRVARLVEDVAHPLEDLASGGPRLDVFERPVERRLDEPVVLDELLRRLADTERAGHVGVAAGLAVAREEVEHDRLAGRGRAGAEVVAERRLRAVGDDHLVGDEAMRVEDVGDPRLDELAGQRLSVDGQLTVGRLGAAEEVARGVHRRFGPSLRLADPGDLGLVLRAATLVEERAVRSDLHAVLAQRVGQLGRERVRDDRVLDVEPFDGLDDQLQELLLPRPLADELVPAEGLERVGLDAGLLHPVDLEGRDHDVLGAVLLDVEERVRRGDGDLVPELGTVHVV